MSLKEIPETRFREIYGGRRIEDKAVFGGELTQPLDTSQASVGYEQLPLQSEVIMDFGRMFNRLNVKKFDGKLIGQTMDREDILAAIAPDLHSTSGMVVAPNTRNMWGGRRPLIYSPLGSTNKHEMHSWTKAAAQFSLYQDEAGKDLTQDQMNTVMGMSANATAQLLIRGKVSGQASLNEKKIQLTPRIGRSWTGMSNGAKHLNFEEWKENRFMFGRGTSVPDSVVESSIEKSSYAGEMYTYGGKTGKAAYENELILDYVASSLTHSSALSFIAQYHDALINVASQTQYLASELVGFYEKGLKGDFLRHYNRDEVVLMFSLVELGAALRRQVIVRNTASASSHSSTDTVGMQGSFNPFFTYIESIGNNKVKRMYTPWWLTMLIDRHYFEYEDSVDDVRDIHREDLFQGIRVLLEAASLEYGMIVKSTGTPYLEFFKDFEKAVLPDYSDYSDVPTLRSLWYAGYDKAEDFATLEEPNHAGYSFFKEFLANNRIVETERLDLEKDYAEMDTIAVTTGDMFKLGQQLLGKFEYTTHHRLTRFGSKSVDVKVRPDMAWRPLSYRQIYKFNQGSNDVYEPNLARGSDRPQNYAYFETLSPEDWDADLLSDRYVEALERNLDFTDWVAFPSLNKGWSSKEDGACHEMNDVATGYGHVRTGSGLSRQVTMYPSFSHSTMNVTVTGTPASAYDEKYFNMGTVTWDQFLHCDINSSTDNIEIAVMRVPVPLAPSAYWRLGNTGMLGSFVRRMNRVYQAWQGRTSGLFRRSELKNLLNFPTYNLARELKMDTPDANLAKNASEILGIMGCGANGYSPGFTLRAVERKLENALVHARSSTGVYGNGGVALDADLLMSPFTGDANNVEDMFFSQHLLSFLTGLYSANNLSLTLPASLYTDANGAVVKGLTGNFLTPVSRTVGSRLSHFVNSSGALVANLGGIYTSLGKLRSTNVYGASEVDYFPIGHGPLNLIYSGFIGGITATGERASPVEASPASVVAQSSVTAIANFQNPDPDCDSLFAPMKEAIGTRFSSFRTYYHYYKPLDGDLTYVTVTCPNSPVDAYFFEDSAIDSEVFNFRTETTGSIAATNGTTFDLMPGHMELYKIWKIFESAKAGSPYIYAGPVDFTETVPSLCRSFGTGSVAQPMGSTVPGLNGFAADISAIDHSLLSNPAEFDNNTWLTYLESRLGGLPGASGSNAEPADILRWRGAAAKVFIYDQDILDKSEGLLGALLYITYGIATPGQMTYASVLKSDGDVEWEVRDSYGWGSPAATVSEDFMATESQTGDIEPLH